MKDITYEQMFEWLELQRSGQNPNENGNKIIDALQTEIGYPIDDEIIEDDYDTKLEDFYKTE